MYQCPVCYTSSETIRCTQCGYDISCDYITYPTLDRLPKSALSIFRQQKDHFRCPKCGGSSFHIDRLTYQIRCGRCGQAQGMARLRHQTTAGEQMVDVTAHFAGWTVTMRSVQNGRYLCADSTIKGTPLMASRDIASDWETFVISPMTADGWIGLRAYNERYLTAVAADDNAPVIARGGNLLAWEQFRIFRKHNDYYIKSRANNKWLSVRGDTPHAPVQASADAASAWERIKIDIIDG